MSLHIWEDGANLHADDATVLATASHQRRTLVTRDLATIPGLVNAWVAEGTSHAGVILVDRRAVPEGNTGALIRALQQLWRESGDEDWTDQVVFLRPAN